MPRAKKADTTSAKAKLKLSDLKFVEPLNESQAKFFDFFKDPKKEIIMAHGVAGTGKTFIALYKALESVLNGEHEKVLIIRSAVQSREIGHLPGDLEEKLEQYQLPYKQICSDLFQKKSDNLVYPEPYDRMQNQKQLDFASTSFVSRSISSRPKFFSAIKTSGITSKDLAINSPSNATGINNAAVIAVIRFTT